MRVTGDSDRQIRANQLAHLLNNMMVPAAQALNLTGAMKHQEDPIDFIQMFFHFIQQRSFDIGKRFRRNQSTAGTVGINGRNHFRIFRFIHFTDVQILNALIVKGDHIVIDTAALRYIFVSFRNKFTD